jgi:hypothetical protein
MKKYLLIFILLALLPTLIRAQQYVPFPDSNATWCCSYIYSFTDCTYGYSTYMMSEKQLIQGNLYNKILVHDSAYTTPCTPPSPNHSISISNSELFIRQDSNLKIVWIYDSVSHTDKILYDFNLSVGDTLDSTKAYFATGFGGTKIITSIDSVIINGTFRKRFNYGTGCYAFSSDTSMIEGIGALHGFVYTPSCFEVYFFLNAFEQNNEVLYGDSPSVCYDFTTSITENRSKLSVTIFPNPFSSEMTLQSDKYFKNATLTLYNVQGQQVKRINNISGQTFTLHRDNLSHGMYFLQLTQDNKILTTDKIIITDK